MLKRIPILGALLAAAMLVGTAGCTPAELQALQGTLKNVDSVSGNVTVTLKDGTTRTFNFTDVKVDTIKQALGSATLEIGDNVTVKIRDRHVEEVQADYAEVDGTIKGVGTANVTVTTKKQGDITLGVTANTTIRKEGKVLTLSDLKTGEQVEVKYDVASENALRINVAGSFEERNAGIEGVVVSTNTTLNTVTIGTSRGDDVTLNVTGNTTIRIEDDRTGALGDIQAGQKIQAVYEKGTMNALKISVEINDRNNQGQNHQGEFRQGDNRQGKRGD